MDRIFSPKMKYDPHKHHPPNGEARRTGRRSIRLKDYDYTRHGGYFVTMCVHNRECLFGEIVEGAGSEPAPIVNKFGSIACDAWLDLPNHYRTIELDEFVVMPNHVHGIIILHDYDDETFVGAGSEPAPTMAKRYPLSEIVRSFKTFSARRINEIRGTRGVPVWQRNYYEHIIRNEKELNGIREYIINNPIKWSLDKENPDHIL